MNTVQYPDELPRSGHRSLSGREVAQRSKAMACIRDDSTACQGQVFVTLFFDGTGNNRDWKEPGQSQSQLERNGHSNVARLFDAHLDEPESGFFRIYIPGIGTPFREIGDIAGWLNPWGVLTDKGGGGAGLRGADRINWGILHILNSVHRYIKDDSPLIPAGQIGAIANNMSSMIGTLGFEGPMRRTILGHWESKLEAAVKGQPRKITQINLGMIGFSRGAATARACANWLSQICSSDDGGFTLAGIPVRTYFMGLFDSVASSGVVDALPGFDGHMAWADGNMNISPMAEACVHFVALHEQRAAFPLEDAGLGLQVAYPGMHSDVGGGYSPGEQGKGVTQPDGSAAMLSQVPLVDMHHAALKAGVPLMTMQQIQSQPRLKTKFSVPDELRDTFNDFLREHGIARGQALDKAARRHAEQYMQWRGLRVGTLQSQPFFLRATAADRADLDQANRQLDQHAKELRSRRQANATPQGRRSEQAKDAVRALSPATRLIVPDGKEPLDAVDTQLLDAFESGHALAPSLVKLFDEYVHDSRAGFRILGRHEPSTLTGGYFRYRRVFGHRT